MKKIIPLLALLILSNSCDDGDLEIKNIDFSEVTAQKCSEKDVIYKIKDKEMLVLSIPASTFISDETTAGSPIELSINSTNQVVYRQYNADVSSDNICPTIPSATPSLLEEWTATAGTIQITTTAVKTTDETTNATRITGYKHYIVFKNITFQKPNGTQVYETYVFGNYTTTITSLPFTFDELADKSSCSDIIYNFNGSEVLSLNTSNYNSLFENTVTTTPRTALIDDNTVLKYQLFNNVITNDYFCASTTPTLPLLMQEWVGVNGVSGTSGIIEVTTSTYGTGFQHTIHLKNVSLKKGNSTFTLGSDYLFGSFIVNP
ncbi:MAG: hypothetical protein U0T80_03450 [Flavobacteriaceae bacterium]